MITKEEFIQYITEFQKFDEAIERIEVAIGGSKWSCNLWESDWYGNVSKLLDIFINSHFTEKGADWVYYYLFENIDDKKVIIEVEDMFGIEKKEYHLNSIDELWDFLLTDKKLYFKDVQNIYR